MVGRSMKGHVAFVSNGILFILNLVALVGGIASIIIIFVIEHIPSRIGWMFIIAGGCTVVSGLLGIFSNNRRGCYTLHLVFLFFSLLSLISAALVIFFKPTKVLKGMHYKNGETAGARKIIKFEAAIFFIVFCIDVIVAIMGICVNYCDLVDYYEDIEMINRQKCDLGRNQATRATKKEESKTSQLAQKMREKYGKWTGEGAMYIVPNNEMDKFILQEIQDTRQDNVDEIEIN